MKMTKRAICLLLAAVMALALTIPVVAMDEPDVPVEALTDMPEVPAAASVDTPDANGGERAIKLNAGKEGTFKETGAAKDDGDMVYTVTVTDGRLPDIEPTRTGWEFEGWYTKAPSEKELVPAEDGPYMKEVYRANGEKVEPGSKIPADVDTLYAYYTCEIVTYMMSANGWKNSFGGLICSRRFGEKVTKADLIVVNMIYNSDGETLNWSGASFDGWYTKSDNGGEIITADRDLTYGELVGMLTDTNGNGIKKMYAHWTRNGVTQADASRFYDATKTADKLYLSEDLIHLHSGGTFNLSVTTSPSLASLRGIEWTTTDKSVAYVDSADIKDDGTVAVLHAGAGDDNTVREATLTAKLPDGPEASVKVVVGHDYSVFIYRFGGSCTQKGSTQWKCSFCSAQQTRYSDYAHPYSNPVTYPATCTEKGRTVQVCTNPKCTTPPLETNIVPALGHDIKTSIVESCGATMITYTCMRDGCGYTETIETAGNGKHNFSSEYTVDQAATCISLGIKSRHCQTPGCPAVTDTISIPKETEHKFDDWKTVIEAHWDQEGLKVRKCTLCQAEESQTIPKTSNIPGGGSATPSPSPSESPEPSPSESPSPSPEPGTTPEPGVTPAPSPVPVPVDPPKTNDGSGWSYDYDTGDYYYFVDGEPKANYWAKEEAASQWGFWYYVGSDGKLATGLQYIVNNNGTGWYFLQPDDANGCIGKMLTGWQWLGPEAGEGWFSTAHGGKNGQCTWTENWGDYDPTTGLWEDGLSHK